MTLLVILVLFWLGLLTRIANLRRKWDNRAARWICVALAALAMSMTLQLTAVGPAVDALTSLGFTALASNCLTVLSLVGARCAFLYMEQEAPRVTRWTALGLTVCAVMLVLFLTTRSNYAEFMARSNTAAPVPPVSWYGYVYVAYIAPGAAVLGWAVLRYARLAGRFSLRHGLRLMCAGALVTTAYAVARLAGMVTYDAGVARSVLYGPLVGLLFRIAIVLVLLGLALPLIGRHLDRLARWVALNRQYRLLFPLWSALRAEFPGISLDPPPRRLPFESPDGVLYRRMIEIWDGLLCLRPYVDGPVDAAEVHEALNRKHTGDRAPNPDNPPPTRGDEIAELTTLAQQYRDSLP